MAENPLKRFIPKDPESGSTPIGTELAEKVKMRQEAEKALKPSSVGPARATIPSGVMGPAREIPSVIPRRVDFTGTQKPYGTTPGTPEKRIDVGPMVKPLGAPAGMPKMHDGGTVKQSGPVMLKKGEKVLTPEQHAKVKSAMSLAESALSNEPAPEPPIPTKVGKDLHIRRLDDKTYHVRKGHTSPGDYPEEESSSPDMKGLIQHLKDHFGEEKSEVEMEK